MNELTENKKKMLKELIKQLHAGESPQEVKERFKQVLEGISPLEIGRIEQELIKEGIPREEIQRLCDVHLAVFREQLEKQKAEIAPENPVHILMEEHKILLQLSEKLNTIVNKVQQAKDVSYVSEEISQLKRIAEDLMDAETLFTRGKRPISSSGETRNYRTYRNNVDGAQPAKRQEKTALQFGKQVRRHKIPRLQKTT